MALRLVVMDILLKAAFAGGVIAFASWLAEKRPDLAGFILALPLASIVALVITQTQTQNRIKTRASNTVTVLEAPALKN